MTWQSVKLVGFAPDLPQDTPGIFTNSSAIVPTIRGFGNSGYTSVVSTRMDDSPGGGAVVTKVDGTQRIFGSTSTKLYELVSGVTTARGSGFSSGTSRWSFAQFGDVTLACNKSNAMQAITTGSFAAVTGAPKASIIVTPSLPQLQFAMAFDYDDGVNNYLDGVFWSAGSNYADWTPSIATSCANIRVTDIGGGWTAAIPFRDGVVAFKSRAMYLGRYVGPPAIWDFERISSDVGCLGKNAVTAAEDAIYFADEAGLWMFDGSYPRPIPGAVHGWWGDTVRGLSLAASSKRDYVRVTWDKIRHRLWFGYGGGFAAPSNFVVFNTRSQLWANHGVLNDSAGSSLTTTLDLLSPDYGIGITSSPAFLAVAWDNSSSPAGTMDLYVMGDASQSIQLNRLRPKWVTGSPTATCSVSRGRTLGSMTSAVVAAQDADRYFDVTAADRFLQPHITVASGQAWEVAGCDYDLQSAGAN